MCTVNRQNKLVRINSDAVLEEKKLGSKSGFFSRIGLISEVLSPRSVPRSPPFMPVPRSLSQRQNKFTKIEFFLTVPVTFESGL